MNWDNVKKIGKIFLKHLGQLLGIVLVFAGIGAALTLAVKFAISLLGDVGGFVAVTAGIVVGGAAVLAGLEWKGKI